MVDSLLFSVAFSFNIFIRWWYFGDMLLLSKKCNIILFSNCRVFCDEEHEDFYKEHINESKANEKNCLVSGYVL